MFFETSIWKGFWKGFGSLKIWIFAFFRCFLEAKLKFKINLKKQEIWNQGTPLPEGRPLEVRTSRIGFWRHFLEKQAFRLGEIKISRFLPRPHAIELRSNRVFQHAEGLKAGGFLRSTQACWANLRQNFWGRSQKPSPWESRVSFS